jgi:N6-adenosine-specific RNA methylase IME4
MNPIKEKILKLKVAIDENVVRRNLSEQEFSTTIKLFDDLNRKLYGEGDKTRGLKRGEARQSTIDQREGWTIEKTAKALSISKGTAVNAIQIVKAVEDRPELAKLKGKQILRKIKIEKQKEKIAKLEKPTGLFDIVVVDPPWEFKQDYDPDFARGTGDYPTLSLDKIKAIKLPTKKDCILWLWVTNNMIKEGFEVLETWGFTFRNILSWDKEIMGIGTWLRNQTEHCLLATKGHPVMNLTNQTTIIREKRTKHSKKPEAFFKMVENLCIGERLDYFSRRERKGWSVYGDEL